MQNILGRWKEKTEEGGTLRYIFIIHLGHQYIIYNLERITKKTGSRMTTHSAEHTGGAERVMHLAEVRQGGAGAGVDAFCLTRLYVSLYVHSTPL